MRGVSTSEAAAGAVADGVCAMAGAHVPAANAAASVKAERGFMVKGIMMSAGLL